MKMKNKQFIAIASKLGISTFLLAGCMPDIEADESVVANYNTEQDNLKSEDCSSFANQNQTKECFEELPPGGPLKSEYIKSENKGSDSGLGWESALFPLATGYLLGQLNNNSSFMTNSSITNRTPINNYKQALFQPLNPQEREKNTTNGIANGIANGYSSSTNNQNKIQNSGKVNLNKGNSSTTHSNGNKSNVIVPNQPAKPGGTGKAINGTSGIGNAKAPAGS